MDEFAVTFRLLQVAGAQSLTVCFSYKSLNVLDLSISVLSRNVFIFMSINPSLLGTDHIADSGILIELGGHEAQ